MVNEYGAVDGMRIGRRNWYTGRTPVPVPLGKFMDLNICLRTLCLNQWFWKVRLTSYTLHQFILLDLEIFSNSHNLLFSTCGNAEIDFRLELPLQYFCTLIHLIHWLWDMCNCMRTSVFMMILYSIAASILVTIPFWFLLRKWRWTQHYGWLLLANIGLETHSVLMVSELFSKPFQKTLGSVQQLILNAGIFLVVKGLTANKFWGLIQCHWF
jgi:hypothetical protein